MPNGTTAQRPTPVTGMLRFNSTTTSAEIYDGSNWGGLGGGGSTEDSDGDTKITFETGTNDNDEIDNDAA